MAYVLKYKIEYKTRAFGSNAGLNGAIAKDAVFEIEELDPANSTVITLYAGTPPIIDQTPDKESKDFKFISTKCVVNIKNTNQYSKLINFITEDERKFRGTLKLNGAIVFRGWLLNDVSSTNEVFNAKLSDLFLTFADGIGTLANTEYRAVNGQKLYGKASVIQILANINQLIGLDLDIVAKANFTAPTIGLGRRLENQKISQLRFFEADRTPFSCKKVLEQLINANFGHFYQREGSFWFVPFDENKKTNREFYKYNSLGVYQSTITHTGFKMVADNEDIFLGAKTATRSYIAPYKKVTLSTKFVQGNLFENGEMEYFTAGASEPFQISSLRGVESQINNITFPNWGNLGAVEVHQFKYSNEYLSQVKSYWYSTSAASKHGAFVGNSVVYAIELGRSLEGAYIFCSEALVRKGAIINLSCFPWHNLKYNGGGNLNSTGLARYIVKLRTNGGTTYVLNSDGNWRTETQPLPAGQAVTRYIIPLIDNSLATDGFVVSVNTINIDSKEIPADGYLQILINVAPSLNGSNALQQFSGPILTIKEHPKSIDKVTYESTISGKHTVIDQENEVFICDNSLELIPCSIYNQSNVETSNYTLGTTVINDHFLLIPLLEKAIQFSKLHIKARLQKCFSHNVQVGDVIQFDQTGFSDMAGKEFYVIGILGRDYRTAEMQIICCEIIEQANNITYDIFIYNQGNKESIRYQIPFTTTPGLPTLSFPWYWANIGNTTGGAFNNPLVDGSFVIQATGQDIWEQADNFGLLYRDGGNVTLEGVVSMPTADSSGGTISDFSKTGIMYRESLDVDSKFFAIVRRKDGFVFCMVRETTGGSVNILGNPIALPEVDRFKLSNDNGAFKAYYHDGAGFVELGAIQMSMASTSKIGFCFAMQGDTAGAFATNVNYTTSGRQLPNKPTNLVPAVVAWKADPTGTPGGGTGKPTNLTPAIVTTQASGTPVTGDGGGGGGGDRDPAPNTEGFAIFTQDGRDGIGFYHQGYNGPKTRWIHLVANTAAGTITDEAWSYNPTSYSKIWKIDEAYYTGANTIDGWRTDPLTNIAIPANLKGKPLTVTIKWHNNNIYFPVHNFQQQFILN